MRGDDMNNICSISERLHEALKIRGIKQQELCRRAGVPKSAMSQYLSGFCEPKANRIHLIAVALNVSEVWLLGYDVPMERPDYTAKEKALLDLFNEIPADRQGAVLDLLKAALNIQAK